MSDLHAMQDIDLLQKLRTIYELIRFYEAAEGEYSREREPRHQAYRDFGELMAECSKRGLDVAQCLQ